MATYTFNVGATADLDADLALIDSGGGDDPANSMASDGEVAMTMMTRTRREAPSGCATCFLPGETSSPTASAPRD